jgi:hypothetical protein
MEGRRDDARSIATMSAEDLRFFLVSCRRGERFCDGL